MILKCILLALSASLDALGLGITYGIKHTKMSKFSNLIIFTILLISSSFSIFIGHYISNLFSQTFTALLGSALLIFLGLYNIYKTKNNTSTNFDTDNSNYIDTKEAFALGIAIAVDASCVSLSSGIIGYGSFLLPILMAIFHTFFINCGTFITALYINKLKIPDKILSVISSIILISIGFIRVIS